jgi:hypothetical protein
MRLVKRRLRGTKNTTWTRKHVSRRWNSARVLLMVAVVRGSPRIQVHVNGHGWLRERERVAERRKSSACSYAGAATAVVGTGE